MVPRKIFHYTMPRGAPHPFNDFRMPMQMLEPRRDRFDISRLHDESLYAIAHNVTCLARGDLRQRAGSRFLRHFRAAFPLRGKIVDGALTEIILRIAYKSDNANIIAPELFEEWLGFIVHGAHQP